MRNMQLDANQAAVLACGLLATGAVLRRSTAKVVAVIGGYLGESGVIAALYAFWQFAGGLSNESAGAFDRGRWIARTELAWHLPSERSAQQLINGHRLVEETANLYYATVHFTGMGIFLVWLYVRHRPSYARVRAVLIVSTALCLVVETVPVAPPRLLPDLGFIDTAAQYGQSVYHLSGVTVDQLAAMPSVHVGWAALVAWGVIIASRWRYRWWILAHPVLTIFVVAATANHFWLDGIVAVLILAVTILTLNAVGRLWRAAVRRRSVEQRRQQEEHQARPGDVGQDGAEDPTRRATLQA